MFVLPEDPGVKNLQQILFADFLSLSALYANCFSTVIKPQRLPPLKTLRLVLLLPATALSTLNTNQTTDER